MRAEQGGVGRRVLVGALTVATIATAIVLVAGRDDGGSEQGARLDATAPTTAPTSASTTAAPATTRGPRGNGNAVTFAFAGDVNFPEVWDTEDGPPPDAPPLAQRVRSDPKH